MSTNDVMTADRVHRIAAWRTDDAAAWELCQAATLRVIDRLRAVDAPPDDTFGGAWDRMVTAMAAEADARRVAVDRPAQHAPENAPRLSVDPRR